MAAKSTTSMPNTQYSALSSGKIQKPAQGMQMTSRPPVHRPVTPQRAALNTPLDTGLNTTTSSSPNSTSSGTLANVGDNRMTERRSERVDAQGNAKLGDPKIYESAGAAGSGFINMSHLLGLNKASGERSALDLAARTKQAGQSALGGINSIEQQFADKAREGMAGFSDNFDPFAGNAQSRIDAAKNARYTGPNDLTALGAYGELAKKVGSAQDMAKNSQSGIGMAAQVGKETGLSPTQSAASAFYMGVNNPNVKRAGAQFTNLQAALENANARALTGSSLARQKARDLNAQAPAWQEAKTAADFSRLQAQAAQKAAEGNAASEKDEAARNQAIQQNHRAAGEAEIKATSDINWNIGHGMPAEIAYLGVSWDEWIAMGSPSYEDYLKSHPEAKPPGSK